MIERVHFQPLITELLQHTENLPPGRLQLTN